MDRLNKAKRRDPSLAQTELGFALLFRRVGLDVAVALHKK